MWFDSNTFQLACKQFGRCPQPSGVAVRKAGTHENVRLAGRLVPKPVVNRCWLTSGLPRKTAFSGAGWFHGYGQVYELKGGIQALVSRQVSTEIRVFKRQAWNCQVEVSETNTRTRARTLFAGTSLWARKAEFLESLKEQEGSCPDVCLKDRSFAHQLAGRPGRRWPGSALRRLLGCSVGRCYPNSPRRRS